MSDAHDHGLVGTLKSCNVTFASALEGIAPGVDEREINYKWRQEALDDKLKEAWARFEVEHSFSLSGDDQEDCLSWRSTWSAGAAGSSR